MNTQLEHWLLSDDDRMKLIEGAFRGKRNAYSPYSNFPVGAALLSKDGALFIGASVDNISYGANICAEQTAIVNAVSSGKRSFNGLAIVSNVSSISPCGICRQVLREFCSPGLPILLVPGDCPQQPMSGGEEVSHSGSLYGGQDDVDGGRIRETTLGKLLPE